MANDSEHVLIGPGSQPAEADGARLDYMPMPGGMMTYAAPDIPEAEAAAGLTAGKALLERLLQCLRNYPDSETLSFSLAGLDEANRRLVDQVLGEGEVSIVCAGAQGLRIQESVLAGVWRAQQLDEHGRLIGDAIEVAAIPAWVRRHGFQNARPRVPAAPAVMPRGVMNAVPLLAELNDAIDKVKPGADPHVINLTLLPQTEQDLLFLTQHLGEGRVKILSRGYGNCRISSTAVRHVWWVQYFNSQDRIILNSLEVTEVPEAARAALVDIQDSAARLDEILEIYRG